MRLLLVVFCLICPVFLAAQEVPRTLTVTGTGQVAAAPDMATVTLGISAQSDTARAAMDQTSAVMQAVFERLQGFDIAPRDIQTSDLSLGPQYDHSRNDGPPRITGYVASNTVSVRVRDLGRLGQVLDAVLEDGANTLNRLSFGLQDETSALNAARREAVADARAKAELFAAASDVRLGAVISLAEMGQAGPVPEAMFARMAADAVPVAAGETTLSAQVQIVYALGD